MYIPYIPVIENFAEMFDLLSNLPVLQERLQNLHDLESLVNQRLGDLDEVQKLKAQRIEIATTLNDAKKIKQDAEIEASAFLNRAREEQQRTHAALEAAMAKYDTMMADADAIKSRGEAVLATNIIREGEIARREKELAEKISAAEARERLAAETVELLNERRRKTMEIWQ